MDSNQRKMGGTFGVFAILVVRYHQLIYELTKREIFDRYAGQVLGPLWAIGHPILLMGLYVFVFAVIFPTRFPQGTEMPRTYVVYILAGLVPWLAFADSLNRGCSAVIANSGLVKQVAFPIAVLPIKSVLAAFFTQLVATSLLLIYAGLVDTAGLSSMLQLLPLLFIFQLLAMVGASYLLASLSVFFRDLREIVQLFTTAGLFLAPILYLPQWLEVAWPPLVWIIQANPFTHLVWCYQDVLYFGRFAHPASWFANGLISLAVFAIGFRTFQRLRSMFGDLL
jgi:lipopolysaccharide transport system permease protein